MVTIQHLVNHFVGNSENSEPVVVRSPPIPRTPVVTVNEQNALGHVKVSWMLDSSPEEWHRPVIYMVYVGLASNPNTVLHGRVQIEKLIKNEDFLEYDLENLKIGQSYNVYVQVNKSTQNFVKKSGLLKKYTFQAESGNCVIENGGKLASCSIRSQLSPVVHFTVSAPPVSPKLSIAGFDNKGVDLEWDSAVTIGNAQVSVI